MLRGLRKASENWLGRTVMGVVMAVLIGSFAVWGINDIFRGFNSTSLAKIGSIEIPIERFQQSYQDRLQQIGQEIGHPVPPQQASALGLDRQVLGEMIAQAGLDQRAREMGLGLSDEEIARRVTSDPNLRTKDGQFDRARFEQVLRSVGLTEQGFIAEQRQTALRRQIIDSVAGGVTPPKAWLDAINQFQNEQRSVQYVTLGPAQAGDIPPPTDEQLAKFFDSRKMLFRAPEYRTIKTVTVTPAELAKWMEVSDDDVKKAYDARRSLFTTPERRHVEQIVFPTMAEAQAAADRIKSGATFDAIAAERGLKPADIDLGFVTKSAMVDPAVADATFALKQGEVSAPVQGQFGAVLTTVLAIDPEVVKTLAEVTPQIRNDLALERAKPQVQEIHDKIEDDRAGGMTLEQAADKEKLAVATYDDVSRNGLDAQGKPAVVNLPRGADVIAAAFASDVGVDNDPIDADGGYVWYDVVSVTPAHERTLDEVKPQVEQQWRANEIATRLKAKADDLLDKLKGGTPFDLLAATSGLALGTAADFKRGGAVPGLSPATVEAAFRTAKDGYGAGEGSEPGQWIVFKVTDVKTPTNADVAQSKGVEQTVQRQLADDMIGQYISWLENELGTTVNSAVLAQALSNNAPDTN